jgi:hypothetical protein
MKWSDAITTVITQQKRTPYGRYYEKHVTLEGATKEVNWRGTTIIKKGSHVSCVTIVMETFIDALKLMGFNKIISTQDILRLKEWCYVEAPITLKEGIAGGLVNMGWGGPVDPQDAVLGDVMQFYDYKNNKRIFGHSTIVLGKSTHTGEDAIDTYSAEYGDYNRIDWRWIKNQSKGVTRVMYIARPFWSEDLNYKPEPSINLFKEIGLS